MPVIGRLNRFFEFRGPDTASTDSRLTDAPVFLDPHGLQIGEKPSFGFIVGVTDIVANGGFFSTDVACARHESLLVFSELACGKSLGLLT